MYLFGQITVPVRDTTKQNWKKSQKLTSQNQIKLGRNSTDMCVSFKLPTHEQRD